MKKLLVVVSVLLVLTGCITQGTVTIRKVVLLPEDRIFTIPAGQEISVQLDKKSLDLVFPQDMKLVSPSFLVRQEEFLNTAMYNTVKANASRNKYLIIFGSVFAFLAVVALGVKILKK